MAASLFLRATGGDNDGMVTTESQRWGEVIEELEADHFAQIGWSLRPQALELYVRILRRVARDNGSRSRRRRRAAG